MRSDAFFLAKAGEEYIGLSFLSEGDAIRQVVQGDTAVRRDWRRQGVATLLKLHTILYAKQQCIAEIVAATASPGMLALNQRLGHKIIRVEVRMIKSLSTD